MYINYYRCIIYVLNCIMYDKLCLFESPVLHIVIATSGKEPILSRINEMYLAADGGESDDDSDLERNDDDDG